MNFRYLRIVLIAALLSNAMPAMAQRSGGRASRLSQEIRFTVTRTDGTGDLTDAEIGAVVTPLLNASDSFLAAAAALQPDGTVSLVVRTAPRGSLNQPAPPHEIDFARVRAAVRDGLRAAARSDARLTQEQRLTRLKELDVRETELSAKIQALNILNEVNSPMTSLLSEKLKLLREQAQSLEMQRTAKEARRRALAQAVERQQILAQAAQKQDAIAQELKNLVELRQQTLSQRRQMAAQGGASQTEAAEAEAALAEAKIRLAEREASLGKAGKGELLDRLTDDLAMVSVDTADLELQLASIHDQLRQYDPRSIDAEALKNVMDREPDLGKLAQTNRAMEMRDQFNSEINKLYAEAFSLKVDDLELAEPATDAPAMQP